jgi:integrase/recombinase XerC
MSARTVDGYRDDVQLFLKWFQASQEPRMSLSKLAPLDLVNYRQHLVVVQKLKPATVNRRLHALKKLCRFAHRKGWLKEDPSVDLKTIRTTPRRRPAGLKEQEIHALLRAAGNSTHGLATRNYALVQLMIQAGLRIGEVVGLDVGDVVLQSHSGRVRIRQGKGRKEREVPLNATARRAIRKYVASREGPGSEEPLFTSRRETRLSIRSLQHLVRGLAHRARITRIKVSAHTLRHSFALIYIKMRPDGLQRLSELMGHDSLDTTAIYTRPAMADLAADLEGSPLNVDG